MEPITNIINSNLSPFDDIYSNNVNSEHILLDTLDVPVAELIEREVMVNDFFIQNREIKNDRTFDYNTITIGSSVNIWPDKNWNEGEVLFKSGTEVNLVATEINLEGGITIEDGCVFSMDTP